MTIRALMSSRATLASIFHRPELLSLWRHVDVPRSGHLDQGTHALQRRRRSDLLLWGRPPNSSRPFAGMLVDRVRRRPVLIATNFLCALGILILLFVHSASGSGSSTSRCSSMGSRELHWRAQSAFLTVLLPPEQLGDANGLLRTVREGFVSWLPSRGPGSLS